MITRRILLAPDAAAPAAPPPQTAPAAAPAPPAPTPSPGPSPAPAASSGEDDDIVAQLDAAYKKAEAPEPAKKPDAPAIPPKAAPAPVAPTAKPPDDKRAPKELRAELDRVNAEVAAKNAELTTNKQATAALEAKIKEFESKGKDTEALMKRLEARDKEFETLQSELRALKQETSPEFKKQYDEPFDQQAAWAAEYVNKLVKADGTQANYEKDFVPLYWLGRNSTIGQVRAKAEEIFGPGDAPEIVDSVKELVKLDRIKTNALEQEKANWKKNQEAADGARVQSQITRTKEERELFAKVNEDLQNSVESYRDAIENTESAALRKKGYQQFDAIVERLQKPKNLQEKLTLGAHMRQRWSAFDPNQLTIRKQAEEIASLKQQLEDHKPKLPGSGGHSRPTGGEGITPDDSMEGWARGAKAAVEGA